MSPPIPHAFDEDLDKLLADLRAGYDNWQQSFPCSLVDMARLIHRAEEMLGQVRQELNAESQRFAEHLDAWRKNNQFHAAEVERLQGELARAISNGASP